MFGKIHSVVEYVQIMTKYIVLDWLTLTSASFSSRLVYYIVTDHAF